MHFSCCPCFKYMEGNYRQKSMHLAFILIMLTSLIFSIFTHVHICHFVVFISMLIKFHLDFFYSLCCTSLFLSYLCKFFSSFFYIHTYSLLHHYTYLYYKREFDYAKNDRSAFNEDEYKLCAFNVALWCHVAVYSLYILVYEYDTNHLY